MSDTVTQFKAKSLDEGVATEVKAFEYKDLRRNKVTSFKTPTLKNSVSEYVKDSRFDFDPLIKDLLVQDSGADEQLRQIKIEVEKRVAEMKIAAETEARTKGHAEGFQAGAEEAKRKFEAEYRAQGESFTQLIQSFEQIRPEMQKAQEKVLTEAIFKIISQIIRRELQSDKEYLNRTIHDVLEKVESREQLRIQVAESQLQQVYAILPELEKQYSALKNISIDPSQQLGEFDVVLETDWNRVDATLDSQLESFKLLLNPEKNES